jgi:hypothetical protein
MLLRCEGQAFEFCRFILYDGWAGSFKRVLNQFCFWKSFASYMCIFIFDSP